jgi:hypothetical protein
MSFDPLDPTASHEKFLNRFLPRCISNLADMMPFESIFRLYGVPPLPVARTAANCVQSGSLRPARRLKTRGEPSSWPYPGEDPKPDDAS